MQPLPNNFQGARMTLSILRRIASGDQSAVRECIDQYGGIVWRLARRFSRTPSEAEDATQDIFFQIWCQAGRFDILLGSERAFIAMVARRRLIDRLRKTTAEPWMACSDELLESVALPEPAGSENSLEIDHALQALAELRPQHREVLQLGLLHGLSHSEIASRLDIPLGTVKSFMRRGLMHVRESMNIELPPQPTRKPPRSRSGLYAELRSTRRTARAELV